MLENENYVFDFYMHIFVNDLPLKAESCGCSDTIVPTFENTECRRSCEVLLW